MTVNADFEQVIYNCSLPRSYSQETWITDEMRLAYIELHKLGFAYSIEIWDCTQSELLGGLYGVKIGGMFCGESMFHHATNVSKIAFWSSAKSRGGYYGTRQIFATITQVNQ